MAKGSKSYLVSFVQNSESIACHKNGARACSPLAFHTRIFQLPTGLTGPRKIAELVDAVVATDGGDDGSFGRIEAQCPGRNVLRAKFAHTQKTDIGSRVEVVLTNVFVPDIVEGVLVNSESRAFPFEFEDDQARVMTSGEKVQVGMGCKHPETILIPTEGLNRTSLGQIPDANCLVFTTADDELVLGMELSGIDIVEMTTTRVNLPCPRVRHAPDFDNTVIARGYDER